METEDSSRAVGFAASAFLPAQGRPVLARLIDDRLTSPAGVAGQRLRLAAHDGPVCALLFQITGQQLSAWRPAEPCPHRGAVRRPSLGHRTAGRRSRQLREPPSWRKIGTLRDLAKPVGRAADPKVLSGLPDDLVAAELTAIPGIGPWTVQGALPARSAGKTSSCRATCGCARPSAAAYRLDHLPTQQEVLAIADKWRPYRSLATSYLFAATFAQPKTPPAAQRQT
jgi:3-methyladenine DNA glycosylase/8-oxoguanine DNA glycosylase